MSIAKGSALRHVCTLLAGDQMLEVRQMLWVKVAIGIAVVWLLTAQLLYYSKR